VKVSIVTPSLNGIRYLEECVESVRKQETTDIAVEHIFVDGGSTDGTLEYAAANGCEVLTREEYNLTFGINKGIEHATGALVGVLGCDDVLMPGAIEAIVRQYQREGRRWLIGCGEWIDHRGVATGIRQNPPPSWVGAPALATLEYGPFLLAATFFERDFVEDLGYFDVAYYYASDYEFCLRAFAQEPFSRVEYKVAGNRRHGSNTSMEASPEHQAELANILAEYGPRSSHLRLVSKYGLKFWINVTSPGSFVRKRLYARKQLQLGLGRPGSASRQSGSLLDT
jgi:glycosyltransferase involved in cell wall biosynthesis